MPLAPVKLRLYDALLIRLLLSSLFL